MKKAGYRPGAVAAEREALQSRQFEIVEEIRARVEPECSVP
jgi:hypothetical protein